MGMMHRWNESDVGKLNYFVPRKSHMDWLGTEPGPALLEAGDYRPKPRSLSQVAVG